MKDQIIYLPTDSLKPYRHNPRENNGEAVDAVAASISEFGFRSPIIIDENSEVINGHTRLKAAKKLGLKEVPCIRVTDLTNEQKRQYRLIDNKTSEYASWDKDLLAGELSDLSFDGLAFDFDFSDDARKQAEWSRQKKFCDLKDAIRTAKANGIYYHSLFKAGKSGRPLEEIKTPEFVPMFAATAAELICETLGGNLSECGWCLATTPRRRSKRRDDHFHFATAVCRKLAEQLDIPFCEEMAESLNNDRMKPEFRFETYPENRNVILYDDVITTGYTLKAVREPLIQAGYVVYAVVSIDNH